VSGRPWFRCPERAQSRVASMKATLNGLLSVAFPLYALCMRAAQLEGNLVLFGLGRGARLPLMFVFC
jgi:hypothetical protein